MNSDILLFVGTGLMAVSAILGIVIGLAYIVHTKPEGFKYGTFYSVFALVASIGYCLASIAFFFNFIKGPPYAIQTFSSLISLAFVAGLLVLAIFVKKDNRILFVVLSFYSLFVIWLAPVFLWNLVYLIIVWRRSRRKPDTPPPSPTT